MTSKKHLSTFANILPFLLILFFQKNLIREDSLLRRDDVSLISAVASVSSLKDYFIRLFNGSMWDIQPVRDLTFYLNLKLYNWFGYGFYHLTNIFICFLIIFLVRQILRKFDFKDNSITIAILFLSCHPVLNTSIAWVSNRKHLLSICFLLFFVLESLKPNPSSLKNFIWFQLSLLSQPITVFILPLSLLFKKFFLKQALRAWDFVNLACAATLTAFNYYFYKTDIKFLMRNVGEAANSGFGLYILRIGRVAVQLFFPVSFAVEYNPGNPLNFLGIVLTVMLIFLFIKYQFSWPRIFLYLTLLTTLFPVLKWGPRDAYLLTTLLLTSFIIAELLNKIDFKKSIVVSSVFLVAFSYYSTIHAKMWVHDIPLHETSAEVEGGLENQYRFAIIMGTYYPGKMHEFLKLLPQSFPDMNPEILRLQLALIVFTTPLLNDSQKLALFKKNEEPSIFEVYYESELHRRLGELEKSSAAEKILKKILSENPSAKREFLLNVCPSLPKQCEQLGFDLNTSL